MQWYEILKRDEDFLDATDCTTNYNTTLFQQLKRVNCYCCKNVDIATDINDTKFYRVRVYRKSANTFIFTYKKQKAEIRVNRAGNKFTKLVCLYI